MTNAVTPLTAIITISNVETLFTYVLLEALVPGALGGLVLFWDLVIDAIVEPVIIVVVYTVEGDGWSSRVGEAVFGACGIWTTGSKLKK